MRNLMRNLPRHERLPDLLAASEDKHVRKTRRIEFVGDWNPMDDDRILAKLLLSESGRNDLPKPYTPTQCLAIRRSAARAVIRHSHGQRLMEHNHQHAMSTNAHLGRTYHWHQGNNFICDVDYRDVDILLGLADGHQFRDITDKDPDEPTVIAPSPEVFKLIAVEAVPSMAPKGQGPQHGDVVAAH